MKAHEIIQALEERHRGELFVQELRGGSGGRASENSYIDAWAMHPYPSKQNARTAYEVKVSRSDFLRDIKKPHKHRNALLVSNEFYFVAPRGMLSPEEMPIYAGLLQVDDGMVPRLSQALQAPWRDTAPPSWRFVSSLCRSVSRSR